MVSERKEGGGVFDELRHADMEQDRSILDAPVAPLPNPGEGGPVYSGEDDGPVPVIPWPNPDDDGHVPVAPLPNPGEGGPVSPGNVIQPLPVQPLPTLPTITYAAVRFLNAAYGYPAFRVYVGNLRAAGLLNFASLSGYTRLAAGYQTVTVTGTDGYIYIQKTIPFESGGRFTVAVINRPGGLDLLRITDTSALPRRGRRISASATSPETAARSTFSCRMAARPIPMCASRRSPRSSASPPAHTNFSLRKPISFPRPLTRISKRWIPRSSARIRFPIPPRRSICK